MQAKPSIYTNRGIKIQEQYAYRSPYVFTVPTVIVGGGEGTMSANHSLLYEVMWLSLTNFELLAVHEISKKSFPSLTRLIKAACIL